MRQLTFTLLLWWMGGHDLRAQTPAVQDFEDLEATSRKGFFKTYFTDLFHDFTALGKPFDYSGGVGINMRSYNAYDVPLRQDPFFYGLNAQFNASIYKLRLPFSLTIAAKNREHSYPNFKELGEAFKNDIKNNISAQKQRFVRFGVSPRYKWIKTHFGHRAMDFSQFTMSNLVFLGAGTELTPGKVRFSAMTGRLAKAEPIDLSLIEPNIPKFERRGWAVKMGYGTSSEFVDVVLFQAHDRPESIQLPDTVQQISPEANQAVGLIFQKSFSEKFKLKVDAASSAQSPNREDASGKNAFPHPAFLFKARQTTVFKKALESIFDFQTKRYTLGVKYRRIDPGYKTLGAYFFNNDIEEITLHLATALLHQQLRFTGNGGIQRNNLNGDKPNRNRRVVGGFDLAYARGTLQLGANYNNNTTDVTYLLNPGDPILNALIVTQDAGFNATYSRQDTATKRQHTFSFTANVQNVSDDVDDPATSAFSRMIVGNLLYNLGLPNGWGFLAKTSYNRNKLSSQQVQRYGLGAGVTKSLFGGKLTSGGDLNYFHTVTEGAGVSGNFTAMLNLNWNLNAGNTLNFNCNFMQTRNAAAAASNRFGELIGTVGYQYRFAKKTKSDTPPAKEK